MRSHLLLPARMSFFTSVIAGLILAGLSAAPVAAANNVVVLAYFGDCQFLGAQAGSGRTVKIEWRDDDGSLKSKHSVTSDAGGRFITKCELGEFIERGDVLKTTIGTVARSVTVPKVTAAVRRTDNDVSGRVAPEPDQLVIEAITYEGGFGLATALLHTALPKRYGDEYWTDNTTWDDNPLIAGWDEVFVEWSNARGDTFVRQATAQGSLIWINRSIVQVASNPRGWFAGHLERPQGTEIAGFSGYVMPNGLGTAYFYGADDEPIKVRAGDIVYGPFEYSQTVPQITAVINKTTDRVTVNCLTPNAGWGMRVDVHTRDFTKSQTRAGFASDSGYVANFAASPAYNIVAGDKVDVYCKLNSGDIFARTFTVP